MAFSYLRLKVRSGRLNPDAFGCSLEDLALDCIADLFERDQSGRFIELVEYYGALDCPSPSHDQLLAQTRRLVFSKVNEGLFRQYRDNDRSLSNTIRNLKNGLRFSRTLFAAVWNNETWVQLLHPRPEAGGLPLLPAEIIEARLLSVAGHGSNLRDLLNEFAAVLNEQDLYQRQYPLIGLAVVLRSVISRTSSIPSDVSTEETDLAPEEIRQFLEASIQRTKSVMERSYIGKGKLGKDTLDLYFDCINDILELDYVASDGVDLSYYDIAQKHLGTMSLAQYKTNHRVYLEYLAKLTRKEFLRSIKKELQHV
jgi:hypothetical protein